eukprot:gnl/TRDRNA2_/TRDRNA2_39251_c0_seq1.p1 gnl/TRDRNA2_/TRDRNA2_39251_c0~~gnl/TRDRNA2_/TRDRNA2_39251_c0_seq1.p1  ORF type:complete len:180 (-),score=31.95 gnl/TRDRNA2_/TRDRNA2_39251_c0_seq1:111-650(-)
MMRIRATAARTLRSFSSAPAAPSARGGGGVQERGGRELPEGERWRMDNEKYPALRQLKGGRQPQKDFAMGPYAHTMRKDPETGKVYPVGTFFVSPKKDPVTFVVNCILAFTTVWTISQLSWGESFFEKRKRVIRERIRKEYDLPKGWEHEIEEDEDMILSDSAPETPLAAAAATIAPVR